MAVSNRVRAALTTTVLTTAATGYLAGCSIGGDDQVAYCTDENGEIVDDDYCDDDYHGPGAGLFFLYLGGFRTGLPVGTVLPRGGTRINPTDTVARSRAGLPSTGKVSGGQRISGGLGSGLGGRAGTAGGYRPLVRRIEGGIVRPGWEAEIQAQGLVYNRTDLPGGEVRSYWREGPFYDFSLAEVERLEGWVAQLFDMCVAAGDHVVDNDLFDRMRIPPMARPQIRRTWEAEPPSVYARFDLRYDGEGPPKLLEFNADTPTGLVESAVTQWNWHLFTGQGRDQWNALHDKLVAAWQRNLLKWERRTGLRPRVHLAWTSEETSGEDRMTVAYLMDTVVQAGYEAIELVVEDIVLDDGDGRFYDQQGRHLDVVFKLYPWEWLIEDEFGPAVLADSARPGGTTWVEPAYKMLWSTKALLPVLWQLFGSDPVLGELLLPAYFADEMPSSWRTYVRKPLLGREGANVAIVRDGAVAEQLPGRYGTEGFVVQEFAPLPDFAGVDGPHHPVLGAWVVDGEPAGLGIRESDGLITDNLSYFVPHTVDHSPPRAKRRPPT